MKPRIFTIAALLLSNNNTIQAATVLTSPTDFQGPTTLNTFETFPGGTPFPYSQSILSDQWISLGMRISDNSPADGAQAAGSTFGVMPHSGSKAISNGSNNLDEPNGFLDFTFVLPNTTTPNPVFQVGLWTQNGDQGSSVSFYSPDGSLIQTLTTTLGDSFVGLRATEGIGRIRISDPGYFMVDDLQYSPSVPEPSTSLFVIFSLFAITLIRVRRPECIVEGRQDHPGDRQGI